MGWQHPLPSLHCIAANLNSISLALSKPAYAGGIAHLLNLHDVPQVRGQLEMFAAELETRAPLAAVACARAARADEHAAPAGEVLVSVRQCYRVPLPASMQGGLVSACP